nr:hypothetical protein [Tanacetum cinerariifolium]
VKTKSDEDDDEEMINAKVDEDEDEEMINVKLMILIKVMKRLLMQ